MSQPDAAATVAVPRTSGTTAKKWLWRGVPVLLFAGAIASTNPSRGDTIVYCNEVARVVEHAAPFSSLWEPGHILWRPTGYWAAPLVMRLVPDQLAWTPALKIGYGYMLLNLAFGLLTALLIQDLCLRLAPSQLAAAIAVALFIFADGILAYSQSGTSYVTGLGLLTAGIWWQITGGNRGKAAILGPAVLFGLSALCWLPFVISVPAACCARRLWPADRSSHPLTRELIQFGFAGAVVSGGILMGAAMAGARSMGGVATWMASAGHGLRQNRQALRAITGCVRLFIDIGADGTYLKRFVFHDPYHPIDALWLATHTLWKPALFYLFLAAVLLLAWHSRPGRRALSILALAGLPALVAAILVFEPSAPERFFPALPFLLFAMAAGWESQWRLGWLARSTICGFALLLPVMNAATSLDRISGWRREAAGQVAEFHRAAAPHDALVALMMNEPIAELPTSHPFDPLNRQAEIHTMWAIDFMKGQPTLWPNRVAGFVLANWAQSRNVWVEKAALADSPADRLLWVEGDNPAIHWRDVPAFFRTLEFDRNSDQPDGFARLAHSRANELRLTQLAGAK
ncbi:MAG TPA: hypothetical protein VKB88_41265 [Bryobacteraceae bacterium]|nr:hypothetical protein [Bryobacteraceae bacterium]